MIEKDEWAERTPPGIRQNTPHFKATDIAGPRVYHKFNGHVFSFGTTGGIAAPVIWCI
jgi:hypothetical protein